LDELAREYDFTTIDATQSVEDVSAYLEKSVSGLLESGERSPDPKG
jgi:thymidylate kinase